MIDEITILSKEVRLTNMGNLIIHRDPTRTTSLRLAMIRDMRRRFRIISRLITKSIVEEDVFGLRDEGGPRFVALQTPGRRAFAFPSSQRKVSEFMAWLNVQVDNHVLELNRFQQIGTGVNAAWTNVYVQDSYRRAVTRARYELRKAGFQVPSLAETGGIAASMSLPFHVDRLGLLYTRTFNELRGVTNAMDQQISRVLTQGIADGLGPATLARHLNAVIKGGGASLGLTDILGRYIPSARRAEMIARTEIIRAHAEATLQEYQNYAVEGVVVKAEWITAGDNRVCQQCADLEGSVFTIDQARNMLPLHVSCRCAWLPYKETTKDTLVANDKVASMMINPEHGTQYLKYQDEYTKSWGDFIKRKGGSTMDFMEADSHLTHFSKIAKPSENATSGIFRQWQRSTLNPDALVYKYKSTFMEKGLGEVYFNSGSRSAARALEIQAAGKAFPTETYLRMRAFGQAYMKQQGIKTQQLYRGLQGDLAEEITRAINTQSGLKRSAWTFDEGSLVGYSKDRFVAKGFGTKNEYGAFEFSGIDVRRVIKRHDIMFPDLGNVTRHIPEEQEWIVRGLRQGKIRFEDMSFYVEIDGKIVLKKYGQTITDLFESLGLN